MLTLSRGIATPARPRSAPRPQSARAAKCDMVRRSVERCGDCAPGRLCPGHFACASQSDAALAAEIGVGWATFVRSQIDIRRPWPPYAGRAAEIAARLVVGLTPIAARRGELARLCHWRAGLRWESLELPRIRDRPYEPPAGGGAIYPLSGGALCVHFRTRRIQASSPPARSTAADSPWSKRGTRGWVSEATWADVRDHASHPFVRAPRRRRHDALRSSAPLAIVVDGGGSAS
jgi:hypothetical protein